MIANPKIDLEAFYELSVAHNAALAEAMEAMQEAQHQYRMLRAVTRSLLNCPALNADGLGDEDIQAIGRVGMMLNIAEQFGLAGDDNEKQEGGES